MLVKPYVFCGFTFDEKQQIGFNAGVWIEDPVRKPHNRMQVAVGQQFFFYSIIENHPLGGWSEFNGSAG